MKWSYYVVWQVRCFGFWFTRTSLWDWDYRMVSTDVYRAMRDEIKREEHGRKVRVLWWQELSNENAATSVTAPSPDGEIPNPNKAENSTGEQCGQGLAPGELFCGCKIVKGRVSRATACFQHQGRQYLRLDLDIAP